MASARNMVPTCKGRAPTARRMAISRRRSLRLARSMVAMPSKPPATTIIATTLSAVSAVLMTLQSSCKATPGRMASIGSGRKLLISRNTLKAAKRDSSPTINAVIARGVRSIFLAASLSMVIPGIRAPLRQSTWMAVIPSRLTWTVRSTGVPVRARIPETIKGLSLCFKNPLAPIP